MDSKKYYIYIFNTVKTTAEYEHILEVARSFTEGTSEWKIALLHDLVEDEYKTFEEITIYFNLSSDEVDALIAITRNLGEKYFDYIERVKQNKLATIVKLADLNHNILRCKLSNNESLLKRYLKARNILADRNVL